MAETQKALVYNGPGKYGLQDVPVPKIIDANDCIGKVILSTICGSDIHIVHGGMPEVRYPLTVGHEFCAEIVEAGPAVKNLKVGDKVVVSCVAFCERMLVLQAGSLCPLSSTWLRLFWSLWPGRLPNHLCAHARGG